MGRINFNWRTRKARSALEDISRGEATFDEVGRRFRLSPRKVQRAYHYHQSKNGHAGLDEKNERASAEEIRERVIAMAHDRQRITEEIENLFDSLLRSAHEEAERKKKEAEAEAEKILKSAQAEIEVLRAQALTAAGTQE